MQRVWDFLNQDVARINPDFSWEWDPNFKKRYTGYYKKAVNIGRRIWEGPKNSWRHFKVNQKKYGKFAHGLKYLAPNKAAKFLLGQVGNLLVEGPERRRARNVKPYIIRNKHGRKAKGSYSKRSKWPRKKRSKIRPTKRFRKKAIR